MPTLHCIIHKYVYLLLSLSLSLSLSLPQFHVALFIFTFVFYCLRTSVFSSSGLFALLVMAALFFWHIQQRSVMGFITTTCGRSCLHSSLAGRAPTPGVLLCYLVEAGCQSFCTREHVQEGPWHLPLLHIHIRFVMYINYKYKYTSFCFFLFVFFLPV